MSDNQNIIPVVLFKLYAPVSEAEYNTLVDIGEDHHIDYYHSLAKLIEYEGADCDYTVDYLPIFEDLFAN